MVKLGIRGYTITQLHKPMVWTFGLQLEILFPLSFQCSLSYIMYFLSSPLDSGSCKSRDCGFLIFHPYILAESLDDRIQVFFWGGGVSWWIADWIICVLWNPNQNSHLQFQGSWKCHTAVSEAQNTIQSSISSERSPHNTTICGATRSHSQWRFTILTWGPFTCKVIAIKFSKWNILNILFEITVPFHANILSTVLSLA